MKKIEQQNLKPEVDKNISIEQENRDKKKWGCPCNINGDPIDVKR